MSAPTTLAPAVFPHDQRRGCHGIPAESIASAMWAPPASFDLHAERQAILEKSTEYLHSFDDSSIAIAYPDNEGPPPVLVSISYFPR